MKKDVWRFARIFSYTQSKERSKQTVNEPEHILQDGKKMERKIHSKPANGYVDI